MTNKFTAIIEKEACTPIGITAEHQLTLVIECPHCKGRQEHEIVYVGNWLSYHAECRDCGEDSLLPNYDWDNEIDALNPLAWIDMALIDKRTDDFIGDDYA